MQAGHEATLRALPVLCSARRYVVPGDYELYADSLPEDERDALLGSIPLIIAMVAGADRQFQEEEVSAAIDQLLATVHVLGPEFRYSGPAQREFDVIARRVRHELHDDPSPRLVLLRSAVRKMPPALRERYQQFVERTCVAIATASGGFLGFGNPISEQEAIAMRKISAALDLSYPPEVVRLLDSAEPEPDR